MISEEIRRYKQAVSSLNVQELLAVLNNSRLSVDERYTVELIDLYGKSLKEAAETLNRDARQINRWLNRARIKIFKQILCKM